MDVCKCIVPLRHGGTLNSRRAASHLMRLVEGEGRWEAPDHHQGFLPLNWGGTVQNRTVTCRVLKAKETGVKIPALSRDEFRGPQSDLTRQCLIGNKYKPCPLPRCIEATEFDPIYEKAQEAGFDVSLLTQWYSLNANMVPPAYVVRSLNTKHTRFSLRERDVAKLLEPALLKYTWTYTRCTGCGEDVWNIHRQVMAALKTYRPEPHDLSAS
ncbi:NACHT and WD repeat domain-containing protein 2 [Trichonephila clavipes]|nr:NACHT and WD repeat domain-containing protein 2 [Trichonephila clavipes]